MSLSPLSAACMSGAFSASWIQRRQGAEGIYLSLGPFIRDLARSVKGKCFPCGKLAFGVRDLCGGTGWISRHLTSSRLWRMRFFGPLKAFPLQTHRGTCVDVRRSPGFTDLCEDEDS